MYRPNTSSLRAYDNIGIIQSGIQKEQRLVYNEFDDTYYNYVMPNKMPHMSFKQPLQIEPLCVEKKVCVGLYLFCVLSINPETIFLGSQRSQELGHTSISHGFPVIMAGEIMFGGTHYVPHCSGGVPDPEMEEDFGSISCVPVGKIFYWDNRSGHYRVGKEILSQGYEAIRSFVIERLPKKNSGEPMLPIGLYSVYSI